MAVYARGYRAYEGTLRSPPGFWIIFREGLTAALRRKGVRWLLMLTSFTILITIGIIYVQFVVQKQMNQVSGGMVGDMLFQFNDVLSGFHNITTLFVCLSAILVGAGLVADDLRTRGLALYLVRPILPIDYAIGKALILPALLIPLALIPGLLLLLLVALWQPPGETWSFLVANANIAWRVVGFYTIAATSLTGLMLTLSSRTARRGLVIGMAAAVLFGGPFVRAIGRFVDGLAGDVMRSLDIMANMTRGLTLARQRPEFPMERWEREWLPTELAVIVVAVSLLALGLYLAWRRARNVEVSG